MSESENQKAIPDAPTFKTSDGREWRLEFTTQIARELLDKCGVNFADLQTGRDVMALTEDVFKFSDALWVMVEKQAAAQGVDVERFYCAIDGATLEGAELALVDAIVNFTPPRRRGLVRAMWDRARAGEDLAAEVALDRWDANQEKIRERAGEIADEELDRALTPGA